MRSKRLTGIVLTAVLVATIGAVAVAATSGGGSWTAGWQMMGGQEVYRPAHPTAVHSLASARSDAQKYADRLGLRVGEVLQFKRNFYAKLVDTKGNGASEVLVDPSTDTVSIEYGPAMMWNTRYGMMGSTAASMMGSYGDAMMGGSGMMGSSGSGSMMGGSGYGSGMMGGSGYGGTMSTTAATVSMADAHALAQRWLSSHEPGVEVETGGDAFPGYYTLETLKGGRITGMISVNATTGAVWPHWWHGAFVAKWEA
jgi:hypothetical protein